MKRILLATAAAAAALTISPIGASAIPYGPGDEGITLDDTVVTPGQDITVLLFGFDPGETVEIDVTPQEARAAVGTITADADGEATAIIEAPTTPGDYSVTGTGLTSGGVATATFTVEGSTGTTVPGTTVPGGGGGGGLPATGSDSNQLVQTGAIVVALGAGLVGVAALRRRRTVTA